MIAAIRTSSQSSSGAYAIDTAAPLILRFIPILTATV